MKNVTTVFGLLCCVIRMSDAYELPDATSRTLIFSDQLNDAVGSANFTFNATHFVVMQKVDRERIAAYKAINPAFIVVQYHKSYGVDLQANITSAVAPYWNNDCDTFYAWVNSHPSYGDRESYYLHYTDAVDSAHRIKHYWNGVNEYYLADLRHEGWRRYVAEVNVRRCRDIGFDGTFFDATYFPSYGYDPPNWFDGVPYNAGGITNFGRPWNQNFAIPYWAYIRSYFHTEGRDYLCIVNCDQMVTGWYDDAYLDSVDGAMAEGFFTYGGKLTGADWSLSAGRILKYLTGSGKNKVLIAQCSPAADNLSLRRWCIGNYLLLKNRYSYYNIASGSSASWWPEYEIPLDSFVTQPANLNDLLVQGTTSLYKREYTAGIVLVNPGGGPQSFTLPRKFSPVTFTGGGSVADGATPQMSVTEGAAVDGPVTIASGEVLILRNERASIFMGPTRDLREDLNNRQVAVFTIAGRCIGLNAGNRLSARSPLLGRAAPGVYLISSVKAPAGSSPVLIVKQ